MAKIGQQLAIITDREQLPINLEINGTGCVMVRVRLNRTT